MGHLGQTAPTRDDVVALQTRVADQSTRLAVVVEGCQANLSPTLNTQWNLLAARALAFASADPSTANYNAGVQVLSDENSFGTQLTGAGCSGTPPPVPVPSSPPSSPTATDQIVTIVKWGAVAIVVASVAYAASPAIRAMVHR